MGRLEAVSFSTKQLEFRLASWRFCRGGGWGSNRPRHSHFGGNTAIASISNTAPLEPAAHDGLRKRLRRQPNNPIAPREFPERWCESTLSEGLLHRIFRSCGTRHRCDRVAQSPSGLNARTLMPAPHRLAKRTTLGL